MGYQAIFKRYELKYIITLEQMDALLKVMESHMQPDKYGHTTIRNIYFDTENYRLIRRSLEKPVYKEKLRIRSYCRAEADTPVFVELKKKYKSVVYKRRIQMPQEQALRWLCQGRQTAQSNQIVEEINYFCKFYHTLHPTMFLSYERCAYVGEDHFRITFDQNILCREQDISLGAQIGGTPLLPEGKVLMELKTMGGIPLWMVRFLTENKIYKTSFSKYGTAYLRKIMTKSKGERNYA